MASLLLIALLSLAGTSFSAHVSTYLKDGIQAPPNFYLWQGSLRPVFRKHTCGVSLISTTWALTAASCVTSGPYEVMFGDVNLAGTLGTVRPVLEVVLHEGYQVNPVTQRPVNNIAAIRFAPIVLDGKINKIKLTRTDQDNNAECIVTGWGIVAKNLTIVDDLRHHLLPAYPLEECKCDWTCSSITETNFCAKARTASSALCEGDFGGPLTCPVGGTMELVGIGSWADTECDGKKASVFSRITSYRQWINSVTGVQ